jgi:chromosome segregation ATPase
MVALLGTKVADMEKQENQRKGALKQWKKKVQELEKAMRLLEEEVDSSRQESMERSVMDEASGEALRMLHRQIASLEREKQDWLAKEQAMKDEVQTLEALVKERSKEVMNLKETLLTRDESDKELDSGLRKAKEQIDLLGNVTLVKIDEEELKRLAEREQKVEEQRQAYRVAEMNWEQEKEELVMKLESIQVDRSKVEDQLDSLKQQMKAKEEEFDVIKSELEAQWGHTEAASEKIDALQRAQRAAEEDAAKFKHEKEDVVQERDALARRCDEVEQRVNDLDLDWNESENRRFELESEVHELWDTKETLEKEREEVGLFAHCFLHNH